MSPPSNLVRYFFIISFHFCFGILFVLGKSSSFIRRKAWLMRFYVYGVCNNVLNWDSWYPIYLGEAPPAGLPHRPELHQQSQRVSILTMAVKLKRFVLTKCTLNLLYYSLYHSVSLNLSWK